MQIFKINLKEIIINYRIFTQIFVNFKNILKSCKKVLEIFAKIIRKVNEILLKSLENYGRTNFVIVY